MPKNYSKNLSPRERLLQKYNMARTDLLIIIVLTLVNILLLVTNADRYFLFSASIPYYVAFFGMVFSGRLPAEYYEAMEMEIPPLQYLDPHPLSDYCVPSDPWVPCAVASLGQEARRLADCRAGLLRR